MAKAKKSKAKKTKSKAKTSSRASSRKTKKAAKRAPASSARGGAAKRKRPQKTVKKTAARKARAKKQRIIGEGDYEASRSFLKDQSDFVKSHEGDIPKMGRDAKRAMDGPEGKELRAAEDEARSHSKAAGQ